MADGMRSSGPYWRRTVFHSSSSSGLLALPLISSDLLESGAGYTGVDLFALTFAKH